MDPWYLEHLVCPVNRTPLSFDGQALIAGDGRRYPVVDGMPVMLVEEADQTMGVASASLRRARADAEAPAGPDELYLDCLGIRDVDREKVMELVRRGRSGIDPVVAYALLATNGIAYEHLLGQLTDYPIPELRLPAGGGKRLLDIGCNWGRWSIASARKGYEVTGLDPQLGAVMAARRVARELGVPNHYVCGDARYLPFRDDSYDVVFSYSVLQHLSKENVATVLKEAARVLQPGGASLIQMANWLGVRSFYHQSRRRFRQAQGFEVRYWTLGELRQVFEQQLGPSEISVDCYFGLGLQKSDRHLMRPLLKRAIDVSEALRALSTRLGVLKHVADSVYVHSTKTGHASP